jgi:paraquat-inducible protein A
MAASADKTISIDASASLTARQAGLVSCHACRLLCRLPADASAHLVCPRCGAVMHLRKPNSIRRTWALVLAALVLYVPANVLPVMYITYFGKIQSNTILGGVYRFMISGSWLIALIIFIASIVVPALKLVVLSFLLITLNSRSAHHLEERTHLYRIIEVIGRWSMVDIFAVTIMVALLQLGKLASVQAGPGAFFFAAVVVITMAATRSFDPRLIWDAMEQRK